MSRHRSFTTLAYLSTPPALHRGAPRKAQWLTIGFWVTAIALGAALALVVAASTPSISCGQQEVELGYDTYQPSEEEAVPAEDAWPPVEMPPEKAEVFTVVELPSGNEITVSIHDQEKEAELPVDEERTARPDWLVEAKEPAPMPAKLAERLEELSAEREAMAEHVADEPVLEIVPLDLPDTIDPTNPDGVNLVESVISDVAPSAAPPPAPPKEKPGDLKGIEQLDAVQTE